MICEQLPQLRVRDLGEISSGGAFVYGIWVTITQTPCHLGGHRNWFLCPLCDRRCAILYLLHCRKCIDGRYRVELLIPRHRKITKAIRLRARLGQTSGGTLVPFPPKPKRMRWHTYLRLRAKGLELEDQIWAAEHARLFGTRTGPAPGFVPCPL
ncbi:MAG: hypothetical protein B7Y02_02040 [Rhodobacterales bacterium 17-64-5]|nr:MAG: hypothetical protein B7Y02_02040 [Rhodobacterales bacterium 17-64-5]